MQSANADTRRRWLRRYCPNKSAEDGGFEMIEDVMSGYRFKVGQTVSYIPHFGAGAAKSTYKIIQLLPPEGGDFQYRIKSADCAYWRCRGLAAKCVSRGPIGSKFVRLL